MFCETIDTVFDKLIEKYGMQNDLILTKETILEAYFNNEKNKSLMVYEKIKPTIFSIKSNGDIQTIKKSC